MRPIRIVPEYTLLLRYDIRPEVQEVYFRYVLGEFAPALQERHLYLQDAWHVLYGDYPERQIEFITDDLDNIRKLLKSDQWADLEQRLIDFTTNYTRRITRYNGKVKI